MKQWNNYNKFTMSSNPVKYFYEKALAPEAGSRVPKLEMYEHYQKFCQIHRLTPESDQSFSRKLTQDYKLKYKPYKINGEYTRCWIDVKLVDWQQKPEEIIEEIGDFIEAKSKLSDSRLQELQLLSHFIFLLALMKMSVK